MRKKMQHVDSTPSFAKNNSISHDTLVDFGCDFSDDMIDEHVGGPPLPLLGSPRENSLQQSLCRALKSIENIQNSNVHNNQCDNLMQPDVSSKKPGDKRTAKTVQGQLASLKLAHGVKPAGSRLERNMNQQLLKKQKKLKDLKQELEDNQMKECTFAPNTHNVKGRTPKRNLQEFLRNQTDHVSRISKKTEDLKRKAQQQSKLEESFQPKINKAGQTENHKNKKPAYERLYELKQNKSTKSKLGAEEFDPKGKSKSKCESNSTHKVITLKTSSNQKQQVECHLYEDAQRRNNLLKSLEKNKESFSSCNKPYNKNNEKYGAQKFIRQFCYILECMKLLPEAARPGAENSQQKQNQDINGKQFSFSQFCGILKGLGFLLYDQQCQNQLAYRERSLAFKGFEMLEQYGVTIRNLCVFLLSILGIFNVNPVNFYDSSQLENKKYEFEVDEKEGRRLSKYFDLLYRNYLTSSSKQKKSVNHNSSNGPDRSYISPRHNQHTKQLASKYRTKMIERANQRFISNNIDIVLPTEDNMLTHEDLLVIDNLGRNLEMKRLQQDRSTHLDSECTFYPKVNHHSPHPYCLTDRDRDRGKQKSRQLYEYAKNRQQVEKNTQSVSKEGNSHQLSHFSEISKQHNKSKNYTDHQVSSNFKSPSRSTHREHEKGTNLQKSPRQCPEFAKDVDKAIARMALGRKQRELKNKLLQRGEPDLSSKKTKAKSPSKPTHAASSMEYRANNSPRATQNLVQRETEVHQFNNMLYQDSSEPFLVIDINMGEYTDQIELYGGDEKKIGAIVDEFCADHDLDEESKEQLLQLVEIQMMKYLNNLGADSTDC